MYICLVASLESPNGCIFQLESIIGKLKTEKYGERILEEVMRHEAFSEQLVEEDSTKEETCKSRSRKRAKTHKDVVFVGSSEEEEEAA